MATDSHPTPPLNQQGHKHVPWSQNDELLEREVRKGHAYAEMAARRLRAHGLQVDLTPLVIRESIAQAAEFADEYDLRVGAARPCIVDVKSRAIRFSSADDYPYESAFVDTVSGWDQKSHKPMAIVLVSQITEAMLVIRVSRRESWGRQRAFDQVRRIHDTFYTAPKADLATFDEFVAWLRAREETRSS